MSDNKKYYYLKLKDGFFNEDAAVVLESMENGYIYSNIRFKLYLKSLKYNGKLMMTDRIPYDSKNLESLSKVIRCDVDHLRVALKIFKELDIIEILDNGEMYMSDIQNYIGHSSTEADRKREYRLKIDDKKGQKSDRCPDKNPPELELDIEKEIKLEKEPKKNKRFIKPTLNELSDYINEKKYNVDSEKFIDYYESNGWKVGRNPMKNWQAAVRTWNKNSNNYGNNKPKEEQRFFLCVRCKKKTPHRKLPSGYFCNKCEKQYHPKNDLTIPSPENKEIV